MSLIDYKKVFTDNIDRQIYWCDKHKEYFSNNCSECMLADNEQEIINTYLSKLADVDLEKYLLTDIEIHDSLIEGKLMDSFRSIAKAQLSKLTPIIAAQVEKAKQDGRKEVVDFLGLNCGIVGLVWYSSTWQAQLEAWGLHKNRRSSQ